MTKIAFDNHIKKHKTLGCLAPSCPDQFNEFQAFCKHVNTCKPSWKEIVTSFVQFECFACSKSYKLYQVKLIFQMNSLIKNIILTLKTISGFDGTLQSLWHCN